MTAGKIAEYAVGILVPLGMFWLMEKMGKGTSNPAPGGSQNPKQTRGRCPRFAPPFRIWDITHPVGMSRNPACVPSGKRFASLIFGSESGSHGGSLQSVQQEQERRTGGSTVNRLKKGVRAE